MTDKPYKHEKPLLKYLQDTKGWALIRDMFPLIGLNAHNVFPKELVPGLVSITKYISIIIIKTTGKAKARMIVKFFLKKSFIIYQ